MAITLLRPAGKREKRNALPRSSASGSELGTEAARREGMAEKRAKRTAEGGGSALPVSRADAPELLPNASKREQAAQRLRSAAAQAAEEDRRARLAVYLQRLAESREASKRSAVNALHTARDRDPDLIGAARSNTALRLTDAGTGRDSVPSRWAPPTREGLPFTPSGVVSTGGQAAYDAVAKSDGTVDYTDWEKLTTGQQRERLKRSGLTEGEQWTILNKDESYIRTLGTIADIQRFRSAYGLSAREATELCNALVEIELKKSNAGKEGNPRRSPDYLRYLEEQREKLLHDKGIGGKGEVWYDKRNIAADRRLAFLPIGRALIRETAERMMELLHIADGVPLAGMLQHFTNGMHFKDLQTRLAGEERWLEKYTEKNEPGYDDTRWDGSIINDQDAYPKTKGSFGITGSIADNGCGAIAINNVNALLDQRLPGKKRRFDETLYDIVKDSAANTNLGGVLGMDPTYVPDYYRARGCDVQFYSDAGKVPKDHDAYLVLYFYIENGIPGAHYAAAEYDKNKQKFIVYNDRSDGKEDKHSLLSQMKEKKRALFFTVWGIDAPKGSVRRVQ